MWIPYCGVDCLWIVFLTVAWKHKFKINSLHNANPHKIHSIKSQKIIRVQYQQTENAHLFKHYKETARPSKPVRYRPNINIAQNIYIDTFHRDVRVRCQCQCSTAKVFMNHICYSTHNTNARSMPLTKKENIQFQKDNNLLPLITRTC